VGNLDDGSLGSSGDSNLYCSTSTCSVDNSDEESSNNEATDDKEGNESTAEDNACPTMTEEDNKSTEEEMTMRVQC
jgi:hypothetical protein